jgi:hypothetical protein
MLAVKRIGAAKDSEKLESFLAIQERREVSASAIQNVLAQWPGPKLGWAIGAAGWINVSFLAYRCSSTQDRGL